MNAAGQWRWTLQWGFIYFWGRSCSWQARLLLCDPLETEQCLTQKPFLGCDPPLSLQRDIRCCLPFCVILQWASKGGSKPLLLHKDTVSALQLRCRVLSWLCLFPIQPPLFHSSVGQGETKLPLPGSTTERRKSFLSSCFSMYLLQMSSATDSLPCCLHWNKLEEDIIPSFLWLTDVIPNITQIMP